MAPRRILLVHGKAEASFAHSKRFAQYDGAVHVGASRCEGATEPRGSVWSARSLLPLWLVPRQHALWNRQDCKGEKLFLFQVQCQWAGRSPISARSKVRCSPIRGNQKDKPYLQLAKACPMPLVKRYRGNQRKKLALSSRPPSFDCRI